MILSVMWEIAVEAPAPICTMVSTPRVDGKTLETILSLVVLRTKWVRLLNTQPWQ